MFLDLYTFDVMSDLAFGRNFHRLEQGKDDYLMLTIHAVMTAAGATCHVPWLFPFFKLMPILSRRYHKFQAYNANLVAERKKMKDPRPDIFSWLLESYEKTPVKTAKVEADLRADSSLIVLAGGETTAITLTCALFHLAQNPKQVEKLRAELHSIGSEVDLHAVGQRKLHHLDAVINEALRIDPVAPSGIQMMAPAEGLLIGATWVPGGTIMQVPSYTTFRGG